MQYAKGDVLDGDNVIARDVNVGWHVNGDPRYPWHGAYSAHISHFTRAGQLCETKLRLKDGREGTIFVTMVDYNHSLNYLNCDFEGRGAPPGEERVPPLHQSVTPPGVL